MKINVDGEEREITLTAGNLELYGNLSLPKDAESLVLFAHGSGSSRFSPRNRYVARKLNQAGLATLLFDLLTEAEEVEDSVTGHLRFNIGLLTRRLVAVTNLIKQNQDTRDFSIGYFGASTGAAAALRGAAALPETVMAVVSRGGRPDLADTALEQVKAATLLIVGGNDFAVLALNRAALDRLKTPKQLAIVPGATHLFEEPGALEEVASLATDWFDRYL